MSNKLIYNASTGEKRIVEYSPEIHDELPPTEPTPTPEERLAAAEAQIAAATAELERAKAELLGIIDTMEVGV